MGLLVAAVFLGGCQTYTARTASREADFRSGNLAAAVTAADAAVVRHGDSRDGILHRLEQGAILRAAALAELPLPNDRSAIPVGASATAGHTRTNEAARAARPEDVSPRIAWFLRSLAAFDAARQHIEREEALARVRLGAEASALLTNPAAIPYRGRSYDKVMLHTYQALNYLHLRDPAAARVELNRALQRQRDAVAENARRIAEARDIAARSKRGELADESGRPARAYDIDDARGDPRAAARLAEVEALTAALQPYADYVNPFTTFLDALFFTHRAEDNSDLERGRKSWERVLAFAPDNPHVRADHAAAESPSAPRPPSLTYVIFETGSAPFREETKIELPLFIVTGRVSYFAAAFPRLVRVPGYRDGLLVRAGEKGEIHRSSPIGSMESVVARDFQDEWPAIVTRTIASAVARATLDAVLQNNIAKEAGPAGQLLFQLATAITQAAVNIADTRTWRSLPREFHYVRLATPPDGVLHLEAGGASSAIRLEPAAVNVVYVKSPGPLAPLFVGSFVLKN